jgi:hypothetical protein
MDQFIKYVGLDTHKDTIAVAIADIAGGKPRYYRDLAAITLIQRKAGYVCVSTDYPYGTCCC